MHATSHVGWDTGDLEKLVKGRKKHDLPMSSKLQERSLRCRLRMPFFLPDLSLESSIGQQPAEHHKRARAAKDAV